MSSFVFRAEAVPRQLTALRSVAASALTVSASASHLHWVMGNWQ